MEVGNVIDRVEGMSNFAGGCGWDCGQSGGQKIGKGSDDKIFVCFNKIVFGVEWLDVVFHSNTVENVEAIRGVFRPGNPLDCDATETRGWLTVQIKTYCLHSHSFSNFFHRGGIQRRG